MDSVRLRSRSGIRKWERIVQVLRIEQTRAHVFQLALMVPGADLFECQETSLGADYLNGDIGVIWCPNVETTAPSAQVSGPWRKISYQFSPSLFEKNTTESGGRARLTE